MHKLTYLHSTEQGDDLIAYMARVSNPSNQNNTSTAPKLIRYLIKHKHWSPFEMVDMTMEIKTSRAIAAQILRHRSFSFQEFSQRYSQAQVLESLVLRKQAEKNRQSSAEEYKNSILQSKVREHLAKGISLYNNLIEDGVAKECARMILPLTTETTMYMKGSIRSWAHYIDLRTDLNSFLPKKLNSKIKKKVVDSCIKLLKKKPFLHDKLEFQVIPTCFNLRIW